MTFLVGTILSRFIKQTSILWPICASLKQQGHGVLMLGVDGRNGKNDIFMLLFMSNHVFMLLLMKSVKSLKHFVGQSCCCASHFITLLWSQEK